MLRGRYPVYVVVALVVVLRSAIFVFWEQAHFDSDQAVIGLMAKHLAEGRAFPMFLYGQNYIFAVEAYMAAAVFVVAGASVAALKLPLLAINVTVALLLVHLIARAIRESASAASPRDLWLAAAAASFFILPPPGTAAALLEANGGNLEPFLYVVLLWLTRRRPALFGVIAAVGFMQREFVLYAVVAIAIFAAATRELFTRDGVSSAFRALRSAAEAWLVVAVIRPYSSAAGPGTAITDIHAPANNVRELMTRLCFEPRTTIAGVKALATDHWARLFGLTVEPVYQFSIDSRVEQGLPFVWILFAAAMLLAIVRIGMHVAADRRVRREQFFPAYLALVGAISASALVVARCGAVGPMRYALLSLLLAVGAGGWFLALEERRDLRLAWLAGVAVWIAVSALGHGRLWSDYLHHPPIGEKRRLIRALEVRGLKYGISDYWIAYYVTFLTNERIIMKSEDYPRVYEYDRQVEAHESEAFRISRAPCPGGEGLVYGLYLCKP